MDYTYSYALGLLVPALIWSIIFVSRKDQRREMLIMSSLTALFAPALAFIHTRDWWKPATITHTIVGIEDILYAFFICGIAVSAYQYVFGKTFSEEKRSDERILYLLVIGLGLFFPLSKMFNSIIGFIIPALATTIFVLYQRKDLIKYAVFSGLFVVIISIPSYLLIELITPGWIANTWYFHNLCQLTFLGIPFEEFYWHFLIGLSMSLVYKYWTSSKEKHTPNLR